MTAPPAHRIRLTDPAELIAAVPHLLGFHPRDSLVVVALDGRRLGLTLRADLPPPGEEVLLAEQVMLPLLRQRLTGVLLLVVGGPPGRDGDVPGRVVVDAVDDALAEKGVPVEHAAWTAGTQPGALWRCHDDPGCGGAVDDPATSALAAATVAAGAVTFGSREELAALLAPDPPEVLARRAKLFAAADAEHPLQADPAARRARDLAGLHADAARGELTLDDETVVAAASALCDHRVRDSCLGWSVGEGAAAAEQLWLALVRAVPGVARAEPAAMLACTAYLRGDGALAGLALEAALAASPEHALARLLHAALEDSLPPGLLCSVARDAAADAAVALGSTE